MNQYLNWTNKGLLVSNGVVISSDVVVDHLVSDDSVRINYADELGVNQYIYNSLTDGSITPITDTDGMVNSLLLNNKDSYLFWNNKESDNPF